MISRTQPRRVVSHDDAIRLARDLYGLEVSARALPGEYDDNFHLEAADGRAFVLKVMHASRERAFLDLQCQALQHIEERAPEIVLPRVQLTLQGEAFTRVALTNGEERFIWLVSFLQGKMLAEVRPHSGELLHNLGRLLGGIDHALQDFSHPAAVRELKWDSARALWIRKYLSHIQDSSRRAIVDRALGRYEAEVAPLLSNLRKGVIYGDGNDHNLLVNEASAKTPTAVSVIDFGDMHHGLIVSEPAIAAAYAILGKSDPLAAAAALVSGFHRAFPLEEAELSVLFPLIETRLAVSVVNSACRKLVVPDDPYVTVSEGPAWEALGRLAKIPSRFAYYTFRQACDLPPVKKISGLHHWLKNCGGTSGPVLDLDLRIEPCHVFDLSVSSTFLGADPRNAETPALAGAIERKLKQAGSAVGIGRYDEPRLLYTSPLFGGENPTDERRTVHLGIDLFVPAGSIVYAPLDGTIHTVANNSASLDYGPVVIVRHEMGDSQEFFTLYGHLSRESLTNLSKGQRIEKGHILAKIGTAEENGGWPSHLHFQIIADLFEWNENFPGVAAASERQIWKNLCPDPNWLLGIPPDRFPREMTAAETLSERHRFLGQNLSISYKNPLKIVRGWRQYVYDDTGRAYLDAYNNVPLVGHSHPKVVRAIEEQSSLLNTNTRYLHDNLVLYARRLTEKLPNPLRVCYFVNSGSEANELALRLARARTRSDDTIVLEHAYHGHTTTLIDISSYKFDGPGGSGCKPWVHVAPIPDDYRGIYRRGESDLGVSYARHVEGIVDRLRQQRRAVAFIAESMPSVAGQIVFPPGYLAEVYRHVQGAGGICIADEVQVGFGRLGRHFWGFESQGVVPDIVVLGKPIGNSFPLAAVITTREIAACFDNGMEFFSTFGGNPVSCAAGLAVLEVLEEEHLQENALRVGDSLMSALKELQTRHPLIGDVRGSGLFLGLDLVEDRETRRPATQEASYITNRLRECGILTGTDGPYRNVIKLRPPLIFCQADSELLVATLNSILAEDPAKPQPSAWPLC
jgi:4-aminobutyrate aminotransferase-like enzyme/Ser/Thr protein kinase RdoA (MazF antagonist)